MNFLSGIKGKMEGPIMKWASARQNTPTPLTDTTDPDDVFIVAYPKSGITWLRLMAVSLVYGADPEHMPNDLFDWLAPELMTSINYKRWRTPMLFKSHDLPDPRFKRVVYLVRDGRDVVVSYYHFLQAIGHGAGFSEMVQPDFRIHPCHWHKHVEAWLRNPYQAEIMMIRYEDLKRNPIEELKRFCEYVGIERDDRLFEVVVRNASFEKMRARELKEGFHTFPRDKAFVRRGVVGSFKDEMPGEALARFTEMSKTALEKLGYLQEKVALSSCS